MKLNKRGEVLTRKKKSELITQSGVTGIAKNNSYNKEAGA